MHVRFLVENTGQTPLHLFRDVGQCSSQLGWLSLDLRDQRNHKVEDWECSADDFEFGTRDVVGILSSSQSGIVLKKGEIYGREEGYNLPKMNGTFRLRAEIAPAGLTDQQREVLKQHQMRVLHTACLSDTVTITVK